MHKRLPVPLIPVVLGLVVGLLLALLSACTRAEATPARVSSVAVFRLAPEDPDSARYAVGWTAPKPHPRRLAVAGYELRVVQGSDTLLRSTAGATDGARAIALPLPALGDSIGPLRVLIRTLDTAGQRSTWASSDPWYLTSTPLAPEPPGEIRAEPVPDEVVAIAIRPEAIELEEGATGQLCGFVVRSSGATGIASNGGPHDPACHGHYRTWRGELGLSTPPGRPPVFEDVVLDWRITDDQPAATVAAQVIA